MIELTVKTLDSQNHQFTVEDDITVEQFKVKIAETVNIPAETQRIIYCGRVLQDSSKLADYDVHGKVVHLVQRPPPGTNPRPSSRPVSPQPQPQRRTFRGFRGMDAGNPMYLASMAFPGNLMESQGIVPPPPTHSLSGSRLIVAKRMLRRAENILTLMENPNARPQDIVPDDNQEEEVTPVIEARVLVPNRDDQPIADVLNVFHDSLLDATSSRNDEPMDATTSGDGGDSPMNVDPPQPPDSGTTSFAATATSESPPLSGSTENLTTSAPQDPSSSSTNNATRAENGNTLPENASSTSEMADLMTTLNRVQTRFAPFSERYHRFMTDDPTLSHEEQRSMQLMLNRCSEIMHYLGHAYHSLSDIMIRVRAPPPRPLLCRPILIQHSAVVQTGIPIQVEINLSSSDRQSTTTSNSTTTTSTTSNSQRPTSANTTSSTTTETSSAAAATANTTSAPPSGIGPTISMQPGSFVGLPFPPGGVAMRVQSFPVEIRTMRATAAPPSSLGGTTTTGGGSSSRRQQQNNNNNTTTVAGQAGQSGGGGTEQQPPQAQEVSADATNTTTTTTQNGEGAAGAAGQDGQNNGFNFNNPNMEFIMEVTPEGITIDSLETALVDSIQANDLLRGALNGPPPEFLQSLMQMAGQIINHTTNNGGTNATAAATAAPTNASATTASSSSPTATTSSDPSTATSTATTATDAAAQAAATAAGQNSQARGNTQTHPTTATHTRSTPRPHVHLAQQAMAGGFDPFLPCNSHHIPRRHRLQATQTAATLSAQAAAAAASYPIIDNPFTVEYSEAAMRRNNRNSANASTSTTQAASSSSASSGATTASTRSADQQQQVPRLNLVSFVNGFFDTVRRQSENGGIGGSGGGGVGSSSSTTSSSRSSAPTNTGPFRSSFGSVSDAFSGGRSSSYDMPLLASLFSSMGVRNLPDVFRRSNSNVQLMQTVQHTSTYPGESLLGDLQRIIFRNLTYLDIIALSSGNSDPIARNLSALRDFVRTRVCNNDTSPHGIQMAVDRLLIELRPTLEHLNLIQVHDGVDLIASVERLLRNKLPRLVDICLNLDQNNVCGLIDICISLTNTTLALIIYCNTQQRSNNKAASSEQLMELILHRFIRNFPQDSISYPILSIRSQLRQLLTNISVPTSMFREFIVERSTSTSSTTTNAQQNGKTEGDDLIDDDEEDNMSESEPCDTTQTEDVDNWVPILGRDAAQHRQRRQNSQGAFSDAYLSGMPSKRRKLINNATKPPESLPQVIADSVRQAVTVTGLAGAAPLDVVADQAGASPEIQAAYRNLLRTTVQASLRDNEDFVPERFPNVANYFKTDRQ